ncbi:hypothetical protein [Actinacidiphila sp. bgisy160]|uniref:hypothetical protein n=1 Tax=Actinacidiphila sp. bgisy160 TaxID=3413796 RepID=UPI003D71FB0F
MRGARILAMATMTAAAVVLPNSQAFAVVDVNVAQNGRSVTVTASSEVCQAPGAMVNANAFPSGLLRNALTLSAATPGGPLSGTFTIPDDAPANTYTITVSCMVGPKSDQGSVGTLTVPATTSTTGDRDGGTVTTDPGTVPDDNYDNGDDEYGDDYEDDYGNYGRGHRRDKCSYGRGGHGRGDDRGGYGDRGDQGDDGNGRGGYGDRGGRDRDHDRKCYKRHYGHGGHGGYGGRDYDRDNDRDNDNNKGGAPDTGFGGSTGMNTAESLTGASLLAVAAAGGVFLLRRRRTQGGEA